MDATMSGNVLPATGATNTAFAAIALIQDVQERNVKIVLMKDVTIVIATSAK